MLIVLTALLYAGRMTDLKVESSKSQSSKASSAVRSTAAAKPGKPARAAAKKAASYVDLADRSDRTPALWNGGHESFQCGFIWHMLH